jgi:hypothetical protein
MPPKTAEQKARKKAMEAEKKARLEAEKATKAAGAAAPPPAPPASSSATPPAPPSTTPAAAAPSATPPSSASAYDNVSSSRLLCLPLDSLAYSLTFLPARELGAVMIASSFVTKTVLPVFQLKFVMSRCKRMLPDPADLAIDVDKNMARAQELLNRAVAAGFNVSADKIARVNKKIAKAQNAGAGAAKAPLLPTRPEDGVVSFPSFARFLDEALQNYCPLRTNKHADMLPEHAAGRFCSCSPEHSVVRAGGGDRGGGGSGVYVKRAAERARGRRARGRRARGRRARGRRARGRRALLLQKRTRSALLRRKRAAERASEASAKKVLFCGGSRLAQRAQRRCVLLRRKRAALLGGCRGETPRTPPTAGEVAHVLGRTCARPHLPPHPLYGRRAARPRRAASLGSPLVEKRPPCPLP